MRRKLTLISVIVRGVRYSAFIEMTGNKVAWETLVVLFPVLKTLPQGATWSYG